LSGLVKLWDAAESFRLRLFIALLVHTCGRPEAVLELTNVQCDLEDGVIHMNAEGRPQTK
jgi:integrase